MSGRFRTKITLQVRGGTQNAFGEKTPSYTDLATVWGSFESVSAGERLRAQQVEADVTHRFTFLGTTAYAGMTPADRVKVGARIFDIVHVLWKDGRERLVEITAKERL